MSQKEWGWKDGEKEVEGGLSGLFSNKRKKS